MHRQSAATVFVVLAYAISTSAVHLPWTYGISNRAICSAPLEVICSDNCQQVQVCISDGQGGYNPSSVEDCGPDLRCSALQRTCVQPEETECKEAMDDTEFTCISAGAYPDPYNCKRYHVCLPATGTYVHGDCPGDSAFNPLKSDCSLTTSDRVCTEGPIKPCNATGEVGVVPENPAIWYICIVNEQDELVPQMDRCHNGQIFDLDLGGCTSRSSASSSTSSVAQSPSSPPAESPSTPPTPGGDCPTVLQISADPEDCASFYICRPGNKWLNIKCAEGSHYDPAQRGCALGACTSM